MPFRGPYQLAFCIFVDMLLPRTDNAPKPKNMYLHPRRRDGYNASRLGGRQRTACDGVRKSPLSPFWPYGHL